MAALAHIGRTGRGYSWFVSNKTIVDKEFIFSGSEQNPDLTDKSLSKLVGKLGPGIQTDLDGRALNADGTVLPGLYACGEAAGFGGGGMHGNIVLEGTFLGGCIHSGKRVRRRLGKHVAG